MTVLCPFKGPVCTSSNTQQVLSRRLAHTQCASNGELHNCYCREVSEHVPVSRVKA